MKLSLVIPCYNEAQSLPGLIERCASATMGRPIEAILVDNGSTDDTAGLLAGALAGQEAIRSVSVPVNRGYGYGILAGLGAADGDILGWTHGDHQTDPMDAATAFGFFERAADPEKLFVKGRRFGRPLVDNVFTAGMSVFETLLTRRAMRDINAQPTLFHRTFFETWDNPPDDFALDLYAYWRAKEAGLRFQRFPVRFGPRTYGSSHWNSGMKARIKFIRRTLSFSLGLRSAMRG